MYCFDKYKIGNAQDEKDFTSLEVFKPDCLGSPHFIYCDCYNGCCFSISSPRHKNDSDDSQVAVTKTC